MKQRVTKVAGQASPQRPVTLEEVKAHLRVTVDSEDGLIMSYIDAALAWCEEESRRAITQRSYLVVADDFPVGGWHLPKGYVSSITSVQYIDSDGATQLWASTNYILDNASDYQARLRPVPGTAWPDVGDYDSAARVTMVAGWATANVPYSVKQALLLKIAHLYEHRAPGDAEGDSVEKAARDLLAAWILPIFS